MARSDWKIRENGDGEYEVYWRGRKWVSSPFRSRDTAEAYVLRVCARYTGDSPSALLDDLQTNDRQRGGPWRYTYPTDEGEEEGVIHTSTKKDAKATLRRQLDRKRLPAGIEWEIAQEFEPV